MSGELSLVRLGITFEEVEIELGIARHFGPRWQW